MTLEQEINIFRTITDNMNEVFAKKRNDYGPSTTETFEKFGGVSMCVRMHDKLNRIDNILAKNVKAQVTDEAVQDTLLDLANYAIITIIELQKDMERKHCNT